MGFGRLKSISVLPLMLLWVFFLLGYKSAHYIALAYACMLLVFMGSRETTSSKRLFFCAAIMNLLVLLFEIGDFVKIGI